MNGNNIYISLGNSTVPIAGTKSNEIQTECETIEISSPTTGVWKEFIAKRKEWSISVSWIVAASAASGTKVANLLNVGTTYTLNIYERGTSTASKKLTGTAICTQAQVRATRGNLATGSFTFKGTGPISTP